MTGPEQSLADLAVSHGGRLPERPGVSGTVDVIVAGTAGGDRRVRLSWTDGRVTGASALPALPAGSATKARSSRSRAVAAAASAVGLGEADLTLTVPADLARALVAGELRPSVAFMRGTLKTAGSNGLVLGVLAAVDGGDTGASGGAFGAWAAEAAKLAG